MGFCEIFNWNYLPQLGFDNGIFTRKCTEPISGFRFHCRLDQLQATRLLRLQPEDVEIDDWRISGLVSREDKRCSFCGSAMVCRGSSHNRETFSKGKNTAESKSECFQKWLRNKKYYLIRFFVILFIACDSWYEFKHVTRIFTSWRCAFGFRGRRRSFQSRWMDKNVGRIWEKVNGALSNIKLWIYNYYMV